MLTPSIPQKDHDERQFENDRDQYRFNYDLIPSLALHNPIPPEPPFPGFPRVPRSSTLSSEYAFRRASLPSTLEPFTSLQSFDDFFPAEGKPRVSQIYQSDHAFAEQRLSGVNPMVLKEVKAVDAYDLQVLQAACPNISIEAALDQDQLYVADYSSLNFIQGGTFRDRKKYLPKPIAFFYFDPAIEKLVPIAVQLNSDPSSPIFTPNDPPLDWLVAKMCVQVADANHHEMATHLCWTHFVMEPFAISTPRRLAVNHPVHLLLKPHLQFLLAINDQGLQLLVNPFQEGMPGGHVDRILAGTIEESVGIVQQAYSEWHLEAFSFPKELKNRGLEDTSKLPNFAYRDDGALIWNAIYRFVSSYLRYFYPTAQEIQGDQELQAWAEELSSQDGGRVKGMPCQISTVEELIEILTTVIFTSGPQHAAINFSQFDYMAFVPNMPQASYKEITAKGLITNEKELMEFLPPKDQAEAQIKIVRFLSFYRHDQLGQYGSFFQVDLRHTPITTLIQQFQQELASIERQIDIRNQQRLVPYPYLKPSLIPNSFSA